MGIISLPVSVEGVKPKLDTFHSFLRLPTEIRRMIWGLAARDFQRGAHFLTALGIPEENKELEATAIFDYGSVFGCSLAAPKAKDIPNSVHHWTDGNPSAYIQDAGMWTACWESRAIMKQRYEKLGDGVVKPSDWFTHPFSGSRFTHKKEEWKFKICPSQDLFCIQPLNTQPPWCMMPFFELPKSLHSGSWGQFANVGLEYDPAWMNASGPVDQSLYKEDSLRGCCIRMLWAVAERCGPDGFKFWLIDRNIRKRDRPCKVYMPDYDSDNETEETEETKPEPMIFQGNDRRYVEVRDLSECEYDVLGQNTVFHFLHWLQIDVGFNIQWIVSKRRDQTDTTSSANGLSDLVKVLCEERM
ncbi:hypothetical protein V8C37DRAFT_405643 [Trichoderma ceciliae]